MTQSSADVDREPSAEAVLRALGTRVDAPHHLGTHREQSVVGPALDAAGPAPTAPSSASSESLLEMQNQARQLAAQLSARRDDLDRRASALNCQQAELENQLRAARLWLDERRDECEQRKQALDDREQTLQATADRMQAETLEQTAIAEQCKISVAQQAADLAAREQLLAKESRRLVERETVIRESQKSLLAERQRLDTSTAHAQQRLDAHRQQMLETIRSALAGVERRRVEVEQTAAETEERLATAAFVPSAAERAFADDLTARAQQLRERETKLAAGELLLTAGQQELATLKQDLVTQREECAAQARHDRQLMAQQQRQEQHELGQNRAALARQSEQLDARRAAMEQMRGELGMLHQEALELRLTTEELWGQLSATVAPALLTKSIATLRARLKDRQRLESEELEQRKLELERLRADLTEQHARISTHKEEFLGWWQRRQQELEDQAAQLVQREQELDQQETGFRTAADTWRQESFLQQQEIRRLHAQLRRQEMAA